MAAVCLVAGVRPAIGRGGPADSPADANQVKAAFVLNFLKFVEWPAQPSGAITVAVVGDDAFATVLGRAAAGQSHNGHAIDVRNAARVADAGSPQLLFIA